MATTANGQKKPINIAEIIQNSKCTIVKDCIPDSIASIIMDAKNISCEIPNYDTVSNADSIREYPKEWNKMVKYLFFDDEIFKSDNTVYGIFKAWATLKFRTPKGKVAYMVLDFSLGKWKLLNENKEEVCTKDLNGNKHQFMRLITILFPDAKEIKQVLNFKPIKL